MYVVWDVIGEFRMLSRVRVRDQLKSSCFPLQTILWRARRMVPMPVLSLRSAAVAHLKVRSLHPRSTTSHSRPVSLGCHLAHTGVHILCRCHHHWHSVLQGSHFSAERSVSTQILLSFPQETAAQQESDSHHFLPVPGSPSAALALYPKGFCWTACSAVAVSIAALVAPW